MRKIQICLILWFMLTNFLITFAQEEKKILPELSEKVYNKIAPTMVKISCDNGNKVGAGVVVGFSQRRLAIVLTACHVISSNFKDFEEMSEDPNIPLKFHNDIQTRIGDDLIYKRARLIKDCFDREKDIALILTEISSSKKEVIRYRFSNKIKPGKLIALLGFPPGTDSPSQLIRTIEEKEENYFYSEVVVEKGFSGGPIVDKFGRMIGMIQGILPDSNKTYALELDIVLATIEPWLNHLNLDETWKYQKYGNFFEKMYKNPFYIIVESTLSIAAGYGIYIWLNPKKTEEPDLPGAPPLPKR